MGKEREFNFNQPEYNDIFWRCLGAVPFKSYSFSSAYKTALTDLLPRIVPPEEIKLIRMIFSDNLTQASLDDFLQSWDIERYGAQGALLLSYIQKKFSQLDFHEYTGPRLAGLFNYYRFRNLELIAQYKKIVGKLNENNIIPVIMKGGALKFLRQELPRIMGDIDILVPDAAQFEQARQIILNMGYEQFCDAVHSIDFHKSGDSNDGILDMHRLIDEFMDNSELINERISSRAKLQKVFQTQSYVPCPEDLVFISLFHTAKNIVEGTCLKNIMYTVFDMAYLTEFSDFDWQIILQNARDGKICKNIYIAVTFINSLIPNLLPEFLSEQLSSDADEQHKLDKDYFYARFVHDVKYARKNTKFTSVLNNYEKFKRYIGSKLQYILTKRIHKSPILLKAFFVLQKKGKSWNI
jgi:hypothetical protein